MATEAQNKEPEQTSVKKAHCFLDVHTHVLPNVDDGARDEAMAIQMLCEQRRQADEVFGRDAKCVVVATPHFLSYAMKLDDYLAARQAGLERLNEAIENVATPEQKELISRVELFLGAEIMVNSDLERLEDIEKLFLGNSRLLMFEFSEGFFSQSYIQEIERICFMHNAIPVIAHFERYANFMSSDDYQALLSIKNVIFQFNAQYLCARGKNFLLKNIISSSGVFILKMKKYGAKLLLGSDSHSMGIRKPSCEIAYRGIEKFFNEADRAEYLAFSDSIAEQIRGNT